MLMTQLVNAPNRSRHHNTKGSKKQTLLSTAPRNATRMIFPRVTVQQKNILVSSHIQNKKTKFNRKKYSM